MRAPVLAVPDERGDRHRQRGRPFSSIRARAVSSRGRSSSAAAAAASSRSSEGLAAGEAVVTSANFLIDAESNLKAALKVWRGASAPDAPDAWRSQ